jgi:hypothetical protein
MREPQSVPLAVLVALVLVAVPAVVLVVALDLPTGAVPAAVSASAFAIVAYLRWHRSRGGDR